MSTTSSVVTLLMIFIIAHAQKRDTDALNLKLDMLIASNANLNNRAVGIETASERAVHEVRQELASIAPEHTRRPP
jgi:low affinity Fe/Cu permease